MPKPGDEKNNSTLQSQDQNKPPIPTLKIDLTVNKKNTLAEQEAAIRNAFNIDKHQQIKLEITPSKYGNNKHDVITINQATFDSIYNKQRPELLAGDKFAGAIDNIRDHFKTHFKAKYDELNPDDKTPPQKEVRERDKTVQPGVRPDGTIITSEAKNPPTPKFQAYHEHPEAQINIPQRLDPYRYQEPYNPKSNKPIDQPETNINHLPNKSSQKEAEISPPNDKPKGVWNKIKAYANKVIDKINNLVTSKPRQTVNASSERNSSNQNNIPKKNSQVKEEKISKPPPTPVKKFIKKIKQLGR